MTLTEINEILKDFDSYNFKSKYPIVSKYTDDNWGNERDGAEPKRETIYDLKNGVFLKTIETQDSYGDNERITGIQFVKPKEVLITQFEII